MKRFRSFKKFIVYAFVIIGAANAVFLTISAIFYGFAFVAIALDKKVTDSATGTVCRLYREFAFGHWFNTILTIISICIFVLFVVYDTNKNKSDL